MATQTVKTLARRLRVIAVEAYSILVIIALVIVSPILCLPVLYGAAWTFAALTAPFTWSERDWDGDGITTLFEFYHATDVGRREVLVDGKRCDEFFAFKDGLPFKTVCPSAVGASG